MFGRILSRVFAVTLLLFVFGLMAVAQDLDDVTIGGKVTDANGLAVVGATVTVTSVDGFPEYFNAATQMRRGQWKAEWTGKAIVNHFRSGFGVAPLE